MTRTAKPHRLAHSSASGKQIETRAALLTFAAIACLVTWMQITDISRWSKSEYFVGATVGYPLALPGLFLETAVADNVIGGATPEPLRSIVRVVGAGLFWAAVAYVLATIAQWAWRLLRRPSEVEGRPQQ